VICAFLNEERHLGALLADIDRQRRRPDELLLVDDGSQDRSVEIAEAFAASRPWVRVLQRPARAPQRDRLASAPELRAFQWGLERLSIAPDVIVKLDADLELPAQHFGYVLDRFAADDRLGMAGAYLSARDPDGSLRREEHPDWHVRGPNRFYRAACLRAIEPIPAILGWDTIDEAEARRRGFKTRSFALPGGDPVHVRPTGAHDGLARANVRWGQCAYAAGAPLAAVLVGGARRLSSRPRVLGGLAYVSGWLISAARRVPRAPAPTRAHYRREQYARLIGASTSG
jgi:glycosyltransferase involved in cell wall biosynthesis